MNRLTEFSVAKRSVTLLLAAALGHATGLVNPWILMFTVWIGSFLGDQCWFFLGRRYGVRVVRRIPGAEAKVLKAVDFVERFTGPLGILGVLAVTIVKLAAFVGFMLVVMLGALIQILPVVAGANLANPLRLARWLA